MAGWRGRRALRTVLGIIMCAAVLAIIREQFFWFALGVVIGSACHELGHMLCAAIVSIPIHSIVVGSGPLLWRGRFGESWFELRLLPFSGFVAAFPPMKCRRYRWALFLLGGVLGNVTVVCLLAGLDASGFAPERAGETLGPVVLVQLFLIIVNLLPLRAKVGGTLRQSDGMQLMQLLWGSLDPAAQLRTAYATILSKYNNGNSQPKMNSDSWRILYNMNRFQLAIDEHSRREYRQALLRELVARVTRTEGTVSSA
jgi:hypothetical protein